MHYEAGHKETFLDIRAFGCYCFLLVSSVSIRFALWRRNKFEIVYVMGNK